MFILRNPALCQNITLRSTRDHSQPQTSFAISLLSRRVQPEMRAERRLAAKVASVCSEEGSEIFFGLQQEVPPQHVIEGLLLNRRQGLRRQRERAEQLTVEDAARPAEELQPYQTMRPPRDLLHGEASLDTGDHRAADNKEVNDSTRTSRARIRGDDRLQTKRGWPPGLLQGLRAVLEVASYDHRFAQHANEDRKLTEGSPVLADKADRVNQVELHNQEVHAFESQQDCRPTAVVASSDLLQDLRRDPSNIQVLLSQDQLATRGASERTTGGPSTIEEKLPPKLPRQPLEALLPVCRPMVLTNKLNMSRASHQEVLRPRAEAGDVAVVEPKNLDAGPAGATPASRGF